MTSSLTIIQPDDWHVHLRDAEMLAMTVPHVAKQFARAIVMPNLKPPVTHAKALLAYRDRILAHIPEQVDFKPLMTLYLTETMTVAEVEAAIATGLLTAIKYYPLGTTTHSDAGVRQWQACSEVFSYMAKAKIPLLIHGETPDPAIDIFDRETHFIEHTLKPLMGGHPDLKIVLEHISTEGAVKFVRAAGSNLGATITAHHLLLNRNDLLSGGLHPHHYCLPIIKNSNDQHALIAAATSGESRFFLGTDSAPHPKRSKESHCCPAGVYTAPYAMSYYAEVFESAGALDKLENFASVYGPQFYGLPINKQKLTLKKQPQAVENSFEVGSEQIVPLAAGGTLPWSLVS